MGKAKQKYEAEKETLAEIIKLRNEMRKEKIMTAVVRSSRSYAEIMAFIRGRDFRRWYIRITWTNQGNLKLF